MSLSDTHSEDVPPSAADELTSLVAAIDGEVSSRGATPAADAEPGEGDGKAAEADPYVLFEVAGTQFLAPLEQVIEVGQPEAVTPVPRTPAWVLGVMNLRGDIVSLVDLRAFLALGGTPVERGRTLVVRNPEADQTLALLVDSIVGMRRLPRAAIGAPRGELAGGVTPHLIGATQYADRLAVVIDLGSVIRSPEMQQFRAH